MIREDFVDSDNGSLCLRTHRRSGFYNSSFIVGPDVGKVAVGHVYTLSTPVLAVSVILSMLHIRIHASVAYIILISN